MDIALKLLLMGLLVWLPLAVLDSILDITEGESKYRIYYARTYYTVFILDLVGWAIYGMVCVWIYL